MKNILLLISFTLAITINAQDKIYKKNSESMRVKIIEIDSVEVKYKNLDPTDDIIYGILRSEVLEVRYENGTSRTFENNVPLSNGGKTKEEMYNLGVRDAKLYYTEKVGAKYLAMGLIPNDLATFFLRNRLANKPVDPHEYGASKAELLENKDYIAGYMDGAELVKKDKIKKTRLGVTIVAAVATIVLTIFVWASTVAEGH